MTVQVKEVEDTVAANQAKAKAKGEEATVTVVAKVKEKTREES